MKVNQQPGFILHRRHYRESSMLVDIFTREYGRLTVIAKGARKNRKQAQGLFLAFKPMLISWTGRGELPILTGIEQSEHVDEPGALQLKCGLYVNELILKLLHRFDAHEVLYDKYQETILSLLNNQDSYVILRIFEKHLLQEIGFGLVLDRDVETGEEIRDSARYQYLPLKGPVESSSKSENTVSGATLMALKNESFNCESQYNEARHLTRMLIDIQLNGKKMRTRRVAREINQYEKKYGT
jgi:DNA repair protein RecO (recombination protein O)